MALALHGHSPLYLEAQALPLHLPPRARRAARMGVVSLLAAAAVFTGLMVGQLGPGTRRVPTIAPTRQPVVWRSASERGEAPSLLPAEAPPRR